MIAIKGMDMPKSCSRCELKYKDADDGYICALIGIVFECDWWEDNDIYAQMRHPACPLIEIKDDITND